MEENTRNDKKHRAKSTFKDILISANNDDVIIPVSATFDKVVYHIGIGNRSGVIIEKPSVKNGKKLMTSVENATRRFRVYKSDDKSLNGTEKESDNTKETMLNDTDIGNLLPHFASSSYCKAPLDPKMAGNVTSAARTENDNLTEALGRMSFSDITDVAWPDFMHRQELTVLTRPCTGIDCQAPIVNTDISLSKLNKANFDTFRASFTISETCNTFDIALKNEMIAITIAKRAFVNHQKEILPQDKTRSCLTHAHHAYSNESFCNSNKYTQLLAVGMPETSEKNKIFSEEKVKTHLDTVNNTGTNIQNEIPFAKICQPFSFEKYISIARDNEVNSDEFGHNDRHFISEVAMIPTAGTSNIISYQHKRYDLEITVLKDRKDGHVKRWEDIQDIRTEVLENVNVRTQTMVIVSDMAESIEIASSKSEKITSANVNLENNKTICIERFQPDADEYGKVQSDIKLGISISVHGGPGKVPGNESDLKDAIENINEELSDTDSFDTMVQMKLSDSMSGSETINTVMNLKPDNFMSDTFNDSQDMESDDEMVSVRSEDEISESGTLNDISDTELDNEIVDIGAITLKDHGEIHITEADTDTYKNDSIYDSDNSFGILSIYANSELHFDMNSIGLQVEQFEETEDFDYCYFSFSNFYKKNDY